LPLAVAVPDALILRAVELLDPVGITEKQLLEACPVGRLRCDLALSRLRTTGSIVGSSERRLDTAGRPHDLVVWRFP
jgi:hypothetical protein